MEQDEGIAILATNLRQDVDGALRAAHARNPSTSIPGMQQHPPAPLAIRLPPHQGPVGKDVDFGALAARSRLSAVATNIKILL